MPRILFWLLVGSLILLSSIFGKDGAIIIFFIAAIALAIWGFKIEDRRKKSIQEKYSEVVAQRILAKEYWIGQTREQLRDSLGVPERVETQENSTTSKEICKFFHQDYKRIRLKITIKNGVVTQIDEK
jgi:hypothetical protein